MLASTAPSRATTTVAETATAATCLIFKFKNSLHSSPCGFYCLTVSDQRPCPVLLLFSHSHPTPPAVCNASLPVWLSVLPRL